MIDNEKFANILILVGSYLGKDSEIWGDSFDEIMACYKNDSSPEERKALLMEVDLFENEYRDNLDEIFYEKYGHDFNPKLWGFTTDSFFSELKKRLAE
jgi:hypothetical protein